jgi:hypothetical protein
VSRKNIITNLHTPTAEVNNEHFLRGQI